MHLVKWNNLDMITNEDGVWTQFPRFSQLPDLIFVTTRTNHF